MSTTPDLLFHCTYGAEDPERATVPFIAASVAAASGQSTAVVCTVDAVLFGAPGGVDGVAVDGMTPLAELLEQFLGAGGQLWLCSACALRRGMSEDALIAGARIVGAGEIVAAIVDGAASITLT